MYVYYSLPSHPHWLKIECSIDWTPETEERSKTKIPALELHLDLDTSFKLELHEMNNYEGVGPLGGAIANS